MKNAKLLEAKKRVVGRYTNKRAALADSRSLLVCGVEHLLEYFREEIFLLDDFVVVFDRLQGRLDCRAIRV